MQLRLLWRFLFELNFCRQFSKASGCFESYIGWTLATKNSNKFSNSNCLFFNGALFDRLNGNIRLLLVPFHKIYCIARFISMLWTEILMSYVRSKLGRLYSESKINKKNVRLYKTVMQICDNSCAHRWEDFRIDF